MNKKNSVFLLIPFLAICSFGQPASHPFRIRTITAGITLSNLSDTAALNTAIAFLKKAKQEFVGKGYEVQTLRVSTQNLHEYLGRMLYNDAIPLLVRLDKIAQRDGIILSIGQIMAPDRYQATIADWAKKLVQSTTTINFSLPISSHETGIHFNSIRAAAEIMTTLSVINDGEANFRFTASANCPAGIPFFPAAFHTGKNSFAIGLEFPGLITESFRKNNNPSTARQTLKSTLEKNFLPVQDIAQALANSANWPYDGIDASPAPGLDASIGEAIEAYSRQPFGSSSTLSACALITDVLKNLDIKKCGYSGLMLPVIEDKILAQRANEGRYSVQELLLFSSVSGTGLDVVPIPGDTPKKVLESILIDVAALSLKYTAKALSARLFLIPGKKAGDRVQFKNPFLTPSTVMKVY